MVKMKISKLKHLITAGKLNNYEYKPLFTNLAGEKTKAV
jgi:hypothetical protein